MRIKKGDKVIVIAGKDRGKTGTVEYAFPKEERVVVGGVAISKRHERSRQSGKKGSIIERPSRIHISNVQLIDPSSGKGTRIKIERSDGRKTRIAKRSGNAI